jgi:hypothetical protein
MTEPLADLVRKTREARERADEEALAALLGGPPRDKAPKRPVWRLSFKEKEPAMNTKATDETAGETTTADDATTSTTTTTTAAPAPRGKRGRPARTTAGDPPKRVRCERCGRRVFTGPALARHDKRCLKEQAHVPETEHEPRASSRRRRAPAPKPPVTPSVMAPTTTPEEAIAAARRALAPLEPEVRMLAIYFLAATVEEEKTP